MGREYRLSRDPRLRQEGDRRDARIRFALPGALRRIELDPRATILGIDVGEDFLDLASVERDSRKVALARVDLRKIIGGLKAMNGGPDSRALAQLAGAITAAIPPVSAPTIALVDS